MFTLSARRTRFTCECRGRNGGALAFIGDAGWGKSTLAANFLKRGYQLVADDIVVVCTGMPGSVLLPGIPECKIWPDTLASLGEEAESLPNVFPGQEKRLRRVDDMLPPQPIPLQRIYVLARGDRHAILPISPVNAALQFVRHTYGVTILQA